MSLWVDGPVITPATLTGLDSALQAVSSSASIPLNGPNGVIGIVWQQLGQQLVEWMQSVTGDIFGATSAVFLGTSASNRGRYLLNQVVTTWQFAGLSPLAMFTARWTLEEFWRQAVRSSKGGDRFERRYQDSITERRAAKRRFWSYGIPVADLPLACPGAIGFINSGSWSTSNLSAGVHAGTLATQTAFDVAVTWVDQTAYLSPTQPQNAESGPSEVVTIDLTSGQSLEVSIAGLNPPGSLPYLGGVADGAFLTRVATGWNVYANISGQSPLVLQNETPIPLATLSQEFLSVSLSGSLLGVGQFPDANVPPTNTFSSM